MSTITKERLLKIQQWRETYGPGSNVVLPAEEAEELARIALASMDCEKVGQWLVSGDTGSSSETMAAIFLGAKSGLFSYPHDPSDFGRCWRLVEKIPAMREAFPRIGMVYPPIAPFLNHWEELAELYVSALNGGTGKAPELYKRMQELRGSVQ